MLYVINTEHIAHQHRCACARDVGDFAEHVDQRLAVFSDVFTPGLPRSTAAVVSHQTETQKTVNNKQKKVSNSLIALTAYLLPSSHNLALSRQSSLLLKRKRI